MNPTHRGGASLSCPDCGAENLSGEEDCSSCGSSLSTLSGPRPDPKTPMQTRILEGTVACLKPHAAVTVGEDATIAEAVRLMREHKMGCVLVLRGKDLAGIFTERDLIAEVAGRRDPGATKVGPLMHKDPITLREDEPVAYAFHSMALHSNRHIPVRFLNGSLGMISSRDLLHYLCS